MNFVFISPYFPRTYWNFCDRLKRNGVNVLEIGDASYDSLDQNVRNSLTEYYFVGNMENYDDMYRAVAFLHRNIGGSTGSNQTTNTGWNRMPGSALILM